jgi:alpha-galactosidase
MSRICLAVNKKFGKKVKLVGLCHEIGFVENYLPEMLNTSYSNLQFTGAGLNHFGVLLDVKYKDTKKDAYPDIRRKAKAYFEKVHASDDLKYGIDKSFSLIMEILRIYGFLPYTHDTHFGEYVHWAWEVADFKACREFYNYYKLVTLDEPKQLKRMIDGKKPASYWLRPSGERVIPIIEGIVADSKQHELSVNLPNEGLIENLPQDIVVECPASVDKNGVHGEKVGAIPSGLAALIKNQATVQGLTAEAALTGSKQKALEALLADPVVDSVSSATKMLEEILQLQKEWLGYLK